MSYGASWRETANRVMARASTKPILIFLFLLCALPVGIFSAILTPPGQVPDEPAHMVRIAGLLHGGVLGVRKPTTDPTTGHTFISVGVKGDFGAVLASFGHVTQIDGLPKVTATDEAAMRDQPPSHDLHFMMAPNTLTYFPAAYVPSALALAAALAVHASPHECVIAARLGTLTGYVALGVAALCLAAYGEALLLALLVLPMTLFLAGSLNQDGTLIAFNCFAAAALTRHRTRWFGIVALVLFVAAKPPYLPLLGLLALPLTQPGRIKRVRQMLLAFAGVMLWVVPMEWFVAVPFEKGAAYHPGPLWSGPANTVFYGSSTMANLHVLLAAPSRLLTLPWGYLSVYRFQLFREMIGILGWLQIDLGSRFYEVWCAALAVTVAGLVLASRRPVAGPEFRAADAALALLAILLAYWGVMIATYLYWTDVGMAAIDGDQGRYVIPLLPFLIFIRSPWRAPAISWLVSALPVLMLGLFDMAYLPWRIVQFYYLR